MCNSLGSVPGSLIDWAAGVIGIPCSVVRAQVNEESGGNANALSPTGAQGAFQFEPGTWSAQGCGGSPNNVNDGAKCYAKLMYQLVKQFHGNVRDALAAYNAGPGNLAAGYGYADTILAAAGQPSGLAASGGTGSTATLTASTTSTDAAAAGAGPDCAFSIGGQHIGILFGHGPSLPSACIIRKTEVRAIMGGLILAAGALVMLPGLVIVMAYGFKATGAAAATARAASAVPGPYGRAVRQATRGRGRGPQRPPAGRSSGGVTSVRGRGRAGQGQQRSGGQGRPQRPPRPPVEDPDVPGE